MAVPRKRVDWAERIVAAVETSTGSGAFEADDRLCVESVELLSDGEIGSAVAAVRTDGAFGPADALARYHPDRRIVVYGGDSILFDGYPSVGRLDWGSGGGGRGPCKTGRGHEWSLVLEHVVGRLARDVRAQIVGRYVRDGAILDGLAANPAGWCGQSVLATGLPCVFNADGVGNCDPVPIEVSDGSGGIRQIHIFAEDGRSDAAAWTFAKVLRYLLHFYGWPGCPVDALEAQRQLDEWGTMSCAEQPAYAGVNEFGYAVLGRPDALSFEAMSALEAIGAVAKASGVHLTAQSRGTGSGVKTSWRVWSELGGRGRELHLATNARDETGRPLYDPSAKSVADLFADNNVAASSTTWDARTIGETALVFGDVKHYEVTVELKPGWLPEQGLDNVAEPDRASAKEAALTEEEMLGLAAAAMDDPWYRAYCRGGTDFAGHWRAGRLWVLNETGSYPHAQYARNAPFETYAPFDLAALLGGRWMRRRRCFLPVTAWPTGVNRVRLEVSFDGGVNWAEIDAGYEVLPDECGVWFDVMNPTMIAPPGQAEVVNLWFALIDQKCRVRVTAAVESDERLAAESLDSQAPSLFRSASVVYAPERFRFLRRIGGSDLDGAAGLGAVSGRDDSSAAQRIAATIAAARSGCRVRTTAVIPWLDDDYSIGDRIVAVRGRGVSLAAERTPSRRHACVFGKRYRFDDGRFQTELILDSLGGTE